MPSIITPDTLGLALMAGAFVLSLALVWLGASLAAAARARKSPLKHWVTGVSVLLSTCGLWWPNLALAGTASADALPGNLLAFALSAALAGLSLASGEGLRRSRWGVAGIALMLTLGVAYTHAMLVAPGLLRLGSFAGQGVALLTLTAWVAGLVAVHLKPRNPDTMAALRSAGVVTGAGVAVVGAAFTASSSMVALPMQALALSGLALGGLVAVAGVLDLALKKADIAEPVRRGSGRAATVDSLTQLPTRVYFEAKLEAAARHAAARNQKIALFFIDLDGFKPVNDTYGHTSGDQVLEQVGKRILGLARGRDVAARVGGDEFLLLVHGAVTPDSVAQTAHRLIERLSEPYDANGREVNISCSVGIALYPDGCEPNKLIARADAAMYAAKRSGGSKHCFYSPDMDAAAQANFEMVRELRHAIAHDQLELYYQPKVDTRSGKFTAAEALVRWRHPQRGLVMPGEFIPVAERFGLIGALGNWVIEDACRQSRAWRDNGLRMRVAINLSAYQMRQDDIVERIAAALEKHRIRPSLLTCEITETAAMEDTRATRDAFKRLGELGVHLSIDDFGTGYSSLAYLLELPAEELKIDRKFVKDLESNPKARAVVEAVMKLAHTLGKKVVAEGVENVRQQQILAELGCDQMQGFLFARPVTARNLLIQALGDRSESSTFRTSLFGETREASRLSAERALPALPQPVNVSRGA